MLTIVLITPFLFAFLIFPEYVLIILDCTLYIFFLFSSYKVLETTFSKY